MKINGKLKLSVCALMFVTIVGCYSNANSVLDSQSKSQVQQRNYQSRVFETTDRTQTMRTVIATLQDLDFIINKADETLGTVSATKFTHNTQLQMSVTIRPRGTTQLVVRANAQYGIKPVEDPIAYQDFFTSLSKAMFLEAQEVT
jgi:uncharacterized membrane protein YhiD involved in acid resistance